MTAALINSPEAENTPNTLLHQYGIDIDDTDPDHPKLEFDGYPSLTAFDKALGEARLSRKDREDLAAQELIIRSLKEVVSHSAMEKLGTIGKPGHIVVEVAPEQAEVVSTLPAKTFNTSPRKEDGYGWLFSNEAPSSQPYRRAGKNTPASFYDLDKKED